MKVLWLEVSQPLAYANNCHVVAGWQDALEHIVKGTEGLDLHIGFQSSKHMETRSVDGVTYHPILTKFSWWESKKRQWDFSTYSEKVVKESLKVIDEIKPDIIHVFGNEWPFGLVSEYTDIPLVIHIQGSIIPYKNANYPPGYNEYTMVRGYHFNLHLLWLLWKSTKSLKGRVAMELRNWKCVHHYMGRTSWDNALVRILSPGSTYHHVDEALRPAFLLTSKKWEYKKFGKLHLVTTGISTFWKGPDMMLKTAMVLRQFGLEFEWIVAGNIKNSLKRVIEYKERTTFEENNIKILGFTQPEELVDLLCSSDIYVHTAYIENSPNSICEAQYLGVPVISTNVGGIETLLDGGNAGILVPANDPWRMADAIIQLSKNEAKLKEFSESARQIAKERHNTENIKQDLFNCYCDILYKF